MLIAFALDARRGLVARTASGGVCLNGTVLHVGNPNLPFGGVGESGMGAYHGWSGFETFSHRRAVYARSTRVDVPLTYPPFTSRKEEIIRRASAIPSARDLIARARGALRL